MHHVLIVDEEEHLLWALEQNLFPDRDDINITSCTTGEKALEFLQDGDFDLLVCDIKMPGKIDGFQLILRAKEIATEAKVIIMTAFGTHRVQSFAERIGVTHYVEKPFNTSDLREAILESLDEKEGFNGILNELELPDIVQMLCLSKRSTALHLKYLEQRGHIIFEKGAIIHAEFDEHSGNSAFYSMLALKKGDIFMQADYVNSKSTITESWQDLLFEGIRLADEARASGIFDSLKEIEEFPMEDEHDFFGKEHDSESSLEDMTSLGIGPDDSFFSDAELEEIESIGIKEFSESHTDTKFKSFAREPSVKTRPIDEEILKRINMRKDDDDETDINDMTPEPNDLSDFDPLFGSKEVEFRTPFTMPESSEYKSIENLRLIEMVTPAEIQEALQNLAKECVGLKLAAVLSPEDGLVLNSVDLNPDDSFDAEGMAPFVGGIMRCAQQTIEIVNRDDSFQELQVQLQNENVLARVLSPTQCVLVTVVDRIAPLGLALVLMKKFQGQLLSTARK